MQQSKKWPKGVRGITQSELDRFGLDEDFRLYWDGSPVAMSVRLNTEQRILAWIVALSAAATALASAAALFM
jgi:hypothetical protein